MKHSALVPVIAPLAGCSKDSEPLLRIPEFEYPFDSLYHGKIFVYKRRQTGEYSYTAYKRTKEAGVDYFVEETYNDKERVGRDQKHGLVERNHHYRPRTKGQVNF